MLRMVVLVAGILLASGADAKTPCTPKRLGVGLGGGNLLSGVSVKKCLTKKTAVQGTLGALVNGVGAGADYMIAQTVLWKGRDLRLRWGVGAGTAIASYGFGGFGGLLIDASAVVELVLEFENLPVEVTTDWRPGYWIGLGDAASIGALHLNGGGGAIRWFFD